MKSRIILFALLLWLCPTLVAQVPSTPGQPLTLGTDGRAKRDLTMPSTKTLRLESGSTLRIDDGTTFNLGATAAASMLSALGGTDGTRVFTNSAARAAAVPSKIGQLGIQLDEQSFWVSSNIGAGQWTSDFFFKGITTDGIIGAYSTTLCPLQVSGGSGSAIFDRDGVNGLTQNVVEINNGNASGVALKLTNGGAAPALEISGTSIGLIQIWKNGVSTVGTVGYDGVILGASGSAAGPGFSFYGDADCGLFRSAANTIGLAVNGAQVFGITTAGATVTGTLSATGSISGPVAATTLSASGASSLAAVSATTGTFSSTVSGVAGTFSGALSGATGDFTGAVSGTAVTITNAATGAATISSFRAPSMVSGNVVTLNYGVAAANFNSGNIGFNFIGNGASTNALTFGLFGQPATMSMTAAGLSVSGTLFTTGTTTFSAALILGVQSLTGAGAVDVVTPVTKLTTSGVAQALTLANGTNGQRKTIQHVVDGGSAVLTPTTKTGFTMITFTNVGESVTLIFHATQGWVIECLYLAVAA